MTGLPPLYRSYVPPYVFTKACPSIRNRWTLLWQCMSCIRCNKTMQHHSAWFCWQLCNLHWKSTTPTLSGFISHVIITCYYSISYLCMQHLPLCAGSQQTSTFLELTLNWRQSSSMVNLPTRNEGKTTSQCSPPAAACQTVDCHLESPLVREQHPFHWCSAYTTTV